MKKQSKIAALGLLLTGLIFSTATSVLAQSVTAPAWHTSKDVQRVANKQLFNSAELRKSHIYASSVDASSIITKSVHRKKGTAETAGNVTSGKPTWIISKGVHQLQQEGRK